MIDPAIVARLREIAVQVRAVMADCRGSVTFHCSAKSGYDPKVEMTICDITRRDEKEK